MPFFSKRDPYIIAEVGQNHQGSVESAFDYVKRFAFEGADAVKFQVRDNKYLFSSEAYQKPYESENAFAPTYGAHREHLELSHEEIVRVKNVVMTIVLILQLPLMSRVLIFWLV